ncbi:antibiotic biosynthesis monooxygenase family protein [Aquamicrobium segne]|uniref:Antibiotic biosynthesis monooxygenase family protein n=1 Tax=Aquamicrobium segne TaxID=469547 RepID=A0ABW0GZ82_9HYPH
MYIAMNRFKVLKGLEAEFENLWKNRESTLHEMQGFRSFHLLSGPANKTEGYTLYVSHSEWEDQDAFNAWMKSQNFRDTHKNLGTGKVLTDGPPHFEGFLTVEGA